MRALVLALSIAFALNADAATFTVNTTSDLASDNCSGGDCSLRGALLAANQTPAEDLIEFNLLESDPGFQAATQHWRILVGAASLPVIEAPVVIDGYSQPGASANTNTPGEGGLNAILKIEIQPGTASAPQQNGIEIGGNQFAQPASTLVGLAISRFQSQIQLGGSSGHRVAGCYLGTDISGSTAASISSSRGVGVRVQGPGPYQIGGVLPAERNLLSGLSTAIGFFSGSDGMRIQGNLIGTDVTGTQAVNNIADAISSAAPLRNAQIGGSSLAARNIIAASHFSALRLFGQSAGDFLGTLIEGNYFGTDVTGTRALGNGLNPQSPSQPQPGIILGGTQCALTIGGIGPGQANLIAYSGGPGVLVDQCRGVSTAFNRFYGNRDIPFDNAFGGGGLGATPNDVNDSDETGGNREQNFPVISLPGGFLSSGGSTVDLQFLVDTALASASYPLTVNFYRGTCGGGSDVHLASTTISSAQAQQALAFTLTAPDGGNLLPLVATAVDALGNTSEFAPMLGDAMGRGDFEDQPATPTRGHCR